MSDFLKRIGLFTLLIILMTMVIEKVFSISSFTDYHWGNPLYAEKISDSENHVYLDVFFLGSSQFYRHINPIEFDQITNSKSYNLGVQGLATPENYFLFQKMLEEESIPSNSTVFIALSGLQSIAPANFYSKRSTYFLNAGILNSCIRIILKEPHSYKTKIFRSYSFLANYTYKTLGLPRFRHWLSGAKYRGTRNFTEKKGFLALDDDEDDEFINRKNAFQNKQSELDKRRGIAANAFQTASKKGNSNKAHLQKIRSLIEQAKEKNINLYFVITPRKKSYLEIINLSKNLPKDLVINLADPSVYPEFYSIENSFDIGHLNKKGARLFTQRLAEEYLKLNN